MKITPDLQYLITGAEDRSIYMSRIKVFYFY